MSVITLSATKLAESIRKKEVSAREVVEQYLAQIDKINPTINAIVEIKPEKALETARQLDEKQARGDTLKPLHGVPFTVKDIFNAEGYNTTAGSVVLKNNIAHKDATLVKRLKEAGAIFIGKTNTSEFENSPDTSNDLFGTTKNPYDLTRSAGGSSGGCGAAVAACCTAFSIGADHGGSLRIPAHYNGITTIRSVGRVPSTGIFCGLRTGLGARFNAEGPLTRSVEDLSLIMNIIQGSDVEDPYVQPCSSLQNLTLNFKDYRFAYFTENNSVSMNPDVAQAVENASRVLSSAGTDMQYYKPPSFDEGFKMHSQICGPEVTIGFKALAEHFKLTKPSATIPAILEYFIPYQCDLPTYLQRWNDWDIYRSKMLRFFDDYDAFICPITPSDALPLETPMWFGKVNMASFCWAISSTLFPAVAVRAGTSKAGLPIGIQIVVKPGNDNLALAAAKHIEVALGGWKKPLCGASTL